MRGLHVPHLLLHGLDFLAVQRLGGTVELVLGKLIAIRSGVPGHAVADRLETEFRAGAGYELELGQKLPIELAIEAWALF